MQEGEHQREQDSELPNSEQSSEPQETVAELSGENASDLADRRPTMQNDVEEPTVALEYKHALAIRWMHWINFPLLALMIYSGLLIYWADSHHEGLFAHRYYRVGIGEWTLFRLFPDWFYKKLDLEFQLAKGLGYHFFFYVVFRAEWTAVCALHGALRRVAISRAQ